ncbi:16S rRNA (guanine(527)-N(7))-methyltransferase RsmG [Hankyongella ginsenosidimutans]|uniref:Ribosomal RNA small subunit methyltransferase G n=1 Tax=Hankyongella ginsenosidimutans TaxID=1763828 RepID=A0A4D7C6C6_9SPHN|nr:16S rRNA (guanine(527)-N(7))-methyltransferase RsmG [Hankyongella ginsenosidimutans]QCI79360.1 16S rRNA (guanine(527)-N(7))-methyltransferase RsmG [Hankyongella ginsenosidimutans]
MLYDQAQFERDSGVSRETADKLALYAEMLADWQSRMNLVGPATLPDVWRRHMLDSTQLWALIRDPASILDIGSGAGFPGLVLAILGAGHVTLVDSVAKKARFLEAVAAALDLTDRVTVCNARIEALPPQRYTTITARACASLAQLFDWGTASRQTRRNGSCPKGKRGRGADGGAHQWQFAHSLHSSRTDPRGRIVDAWNIAPVAASGRAGLKGRR